MAVAAAPVFRILRRIGSMVGVLLDYCGGPCVRLQGSSDLLRDPQPSSSVIIRAGREGEADSSCLTARSESPAAFGAPNAAAALGTPFGRRCIPADCVAPPSNIPDILGRRALSAGRLAALGATPDFHHGLLTPIRLMMRSPAESGAMVH